MKILSIQELILLNKYVQELILIAEINKWFLSHNEIEKQSIVKSIWILAIQAQVYESDIPNAIMAAGLKSTHTPVVMISHGNLSFHNRGYKLSTLKGSVLNQAFHLVLECFALAERRRKKREGNLQCTHWWHKDLSDEHIVQEIMEKF